MNNVLFKDTMRTIGRTSPRFFSIVLIVALGISFFAGMNATSPDMLNTAEEYYKVSNASDIRIISTAGLTEDDISVLSSISGVESVMGEKFCDGTVSVNGSKISDIDGSRLTVRAYSLNVQKASAASLGEDDRSYINRPQLIEGSWPVSANQCVVDRSRLSTPAEFQIGATVEIEGDSTDINGRLQNTQYTIVGIIRTPLYISYERGNTTIGTGKLGTFIYVPEENFKDDYYSAASLKIAGTDKTKPYSKEYDALVEPYVTFISSIASERIKPRAQYLKSLYAEEIAESELTYATLKAETDEKIAEGEKQVQQILDIAANGDKQLAEYKRQYNEKVVEAEKILNDNKLEHSTQYALYEEKRNAYNQAKALVDKYSTAETDVKNARTELNVAQTQVNTSVQTVDYLESLVATTRSAVDQLNSTQSNDVSDIINRFEQSGLVGAEVDSIIASIKSMTAVGTAEEIAAYMEPQLQSLESQLANAKRDLSNAQTELANKEAQLQRAEQLVVKLNEVNASLESSKAQLDQAEKDLTNAGYDIQIGELEALSQLSDMKNQITSFETSYQLAIEKAPTVEAQFEQSKKDAYEKLENARLALEDAKNFLLGLDNAKWYVNTRADALLGYEAYKQSADRAASLSIIFPWFFFLVAALVCLNTMTRMIDDERTQLGTLKAMGLRSEEIVVKYLVYAFIASFTGAIAGSMLGFALFPTLLAACFSILFDMPPIIISYHFGYAAVGITISVGVTVLASYLSVRQSLKTHPSILMKPKAPKGGKRIILERWPELWSRLSFTTKVTCRNVFRNKKRFIMAVIGVLGCTSLLVAAFGLDNSINSTLERQFTNKDSIWHYDMQTVLNGSYDTEITDCDAIEIIRSRPEIKSAMLQFMKVHDTTSSKSKKEMETYILVPEDKEQLREYIRLKDAKRGSELSLPDSGAIITEKLADELKLSVGDSITVKISELYSVDVPVAGIAENYAFHYVYMNKDVYKALFSTNPKYNYISANFAFEMTPEQKSTMATELMNEYEINAVSYADEIQSMFENTLDSLSYIVIVLIVCAGLLCLIVLYNLSVININERVKEIATIKVLGFDNFEVSQYIFRENLLLSIIGTFIGLFTGLGVHRLVILVGEIDIVMYGKEAGFLSFIYAALLSMGFSLLVNLILRRTLKNVDMVESLKSNE